MQSNATALLTKSIRNVPSFEFDYKSNTLLWTNGTALYKTNLSSFDTQSKRIRNAQII